MFDEFDFNGPVSLPGTPTDALPGSEMKIRVMTERAARREQLFHPQDGLYCPANVQPVPLWQPQTAEILESLDVFFEPIDLDEPTFDADLVTSENATAFGSRTGSGGLGY